MNSSQSFPLPFLSKTFLYSLVRMLLMLLLSFLSTKAMSEGLMRSFNNMHTCHSVEDMSYRQNMLLQLRLDKERETRYDILPSQYLPLLKQLLEQENPTLHEKLNSCNLAQNKLCMCYLIALELDDVDMMARVACLSPNSVKKYYKECRQLVESLKEEQGNDN